MDDYFLIEVCEGKRVRNPEDVNRAPLEPGRSYKVPVSQYWMKRLVAKDVKFVKEEMQKAESEEVVSDEKPRGRKKKDNE